MDLLAKHDSNSSSSTPTDQEPLVFPTKPEAKNLPAPIKVQTNFYPFKLNNGGRNVIFEYQVKTVPQLTCHTNSERETMRKLMRLEPVAKELGSVFEKYLYFEGYIYSFEKVDDDALPHNQGTIDDVEYAI